MASKKKPMTRKVPDGDRMRFLRRKAASGTATDAEHRELEKLMAKPTAPKTLDGQTSFDDSIQGAEPRHPPEGTEPAQAESDSSDSGGPPPPPDMGTNPISPPTPPVIHRLKAFAGRLPAPPTPPRVERDAPGETKQGKAKESDSWRTPYEEAAKGSGREATVLFFASRWLGGLKTMSDAIKSVGGTPMVDVESDDVKAMLVLTVDEFLPAKVQLKPPHMAAFATTSLTVQVFMHRKEIAAEQQKVKARVDTRVAREAAVAKQKAAEENNRVSIVPPDPVPDAPPTQPADNPPSSVAVGRIPTNGTAHPGSIQVPVATPIEVEKKEPYVGPTSIDPNDPF
jgi:hypothetical protein